MTVEVIISIIGAIGGWELIRYVLNLRTNRRKEDAEADSAENSATKEMQDAYQRFIEDATQKVDEQRVYINELKESRKQLRDECEDLRKRIDDNEKLMRQLQREVARNGRMVENLRPFVCANLACRKRQPVTISVAEESDESGNPEPLDMKDM